MAEWKSRIINFKKLFGKFPSSNFLIFRLILPLVFLLLLFLIFQRLSRLGFHYEWQWNRLWRYWGEWTAAGFIAGPLLQGVCLTLGIAFSGAVFSSILGLLLAIMRLSPWPMCSLAAKAHINVFRNTPLLLQLFFTYFLLSPIFGLSPFWSAVLALAAYEGAYAAELFRAALLSVPKGQWEAALSLGLDVREALWAVILPQAARNALPAITGQLVSIIKDTSLVSAIAIADLTMRAQAIVAETFLAFEVWLFVGFIYLVITLCISLPALWLEARHNWR